MCYIYDNVATVWNVTYPVAKKEHKCWECRKRIAAGSWYQYVWGIGDDGPFTLKTCATCFLLCEAIAEVERKHGCVDGKDGEYTRPPVGELRECYRDLDMSWKIEVALAFKAMNKSRPVPLKETA